MRRVSKFGKKIGVTSGIGQLMDDLGDALANGKDVLMLGGGNPAHIPEVQRYFRESMQKLLENKGEFERLIGNYAPAQGNPEFTKEIAKLLRNQYGWNIGAENVALTNGSQLAFFILFNVFGGAYEDGTNKKILLPLAPEYIGYSDVGLAEDLFTANKPRIQHLDEHIFKYLIDFGRLNVTEEIGAICASRPTNPSSNVLTDAELEKLSALAAANNIPLIIDNAYGTPFPNIIFEEAKPIWNEHTIVCMSLSKFGLPAVRTGIVIANKETIAMVSQVNAVMSLAPGSMGAAVVTDLVRSGQILRLSREVIRPFYQAKASQAVELLMRELAGVDFHIHKPEGAFFLWLWLPGLPITCAELYERLKKRGVIVVPGHFFFPGLKEQWRHRDECIRVSYAQDEAVVTKGLKIIAEQVKLAYDMG
ncbi:MAG: valine--pyruvate transaminase [Phycisphaerales bacterium]|nr:MAG: valine--pyruvate transaminase [Phycisphaerales bacterium]